MGGALSARADPTAERFDLASPDGYFAALRSRAPGSGRHFTPFGLPLNFAAARFRLAKSNFKAQYRSSPVCKIEPVASTNWWLGASLALPGKASAILKKICQRALSSLRESLAQNESMIPKSGHRFSEKIMLQEEVRA